MRFIIPKGAVGEPCQRCGAEVYWIDTQRTDAQGKTHKVRLPADPAFPGGVSPDSFSRGLGLNHFALCYGNRPANHGD